MEASELVFETQLHAIGSAFESSGSFEFSRVPEAVYVVFDFFRSFAL